MLKNLHVLYNYLRTSNFSCVDFGNMLKGNKIRIKDNLEEGNV